MYIGPTSLVLVVSWDSPLDPKKLVQIIPAGTSVLCPFRWSETPVGPQRACRPIAPRCMGDGTTGRRPWSEGKGWENATDTDV